MPKNVALRRTASEVKKHKRIVRITWAIIGILVAVTAITTVVSILYSRYGSFTVTINRFDNVKYGLALAENREFNAPVARINYKANEDVTNISKDTLPNNLDSEEGGDHSGVNYSAYTFFLRNTGKVAVNVRYQLFIVNMTNNLQNALRVRLYVDGEYVDYAEAAADGGAEEDTTVFESETVVVERVVTDYQPNATTRFTVVLWIEGDDPDCKDELLGGIVKVDMNINVLSAEGEEDSVDN